MNNKHILSNNKIIIFVVFICCALMTSLFIYHTTHKPTLTIFANGNATIFPTARDIKPFELISTENKKFTQNDFINHWTIVFFGFTHCSSICPTTLDMLGHAYTKLHPSYPNFQVVLITLDPTRDTLASLSNFMRSFNPAFIGAAGKIQVIRQLQSQLGIFSSRDESTTHANYQIQHSPSLLLINPQGKWAGTFKYGMTPDQFAAAFEEYMKNDA